MVQNPLKQNLWNTAAKAGLVFGMISSAYLFLAQALGTTEMPAMLTSVISFVLWAVKFWACIYLMRTVMKKFATANPEADNSTTFRLGTATALLSAIVYAAVSFANVAYISADTFALEINKTLEQMAPMMDSNSMNMMDTFIENMPQITFFSNLLYCFAFGTVLSAILSRNIPTRNPFQSEKL